VFPCYYKASLPTVRVHPTWLLWWNPPCPHWRWPPTWGIDCLTESESVNHDTCDSLFPRPPVSESVFAQLWCEYNQLTLSSQRLKTRGWEKLPRYPCLRWRFLSHWEWASDSRHMWLTLPKTSSVWVRICATLVWVQPANPLQSTGENDRMGSKLLWRRGKREGRSLYGQRDVH